MLDAIAVAGVSSKASTQYWLVATPADASTAESWQFDSTGTHGVTAFEINGGLWHVTPAITNSAFDVLGNAAGTAVPEPATLLLLGTGLVGAYRWRKQRTSA